jgi:hypothetical protein
MIDWSIIIPLIAIYGAILSSILLVKEFYELGRKVKVRINLSRIQYGVINPEEPYKLEFHFELHCENKRKRPIQINKVGIKTNHGVEIHLIDPVAFSKTMSGSEPYDGKPFYLQDGEDKIISIDVKNLVLGFAKNRFIGDIETKKIQGWVVDASEKKYLSNKEDFNVRKLLEYFPESKKNEFKTC